MMISTFEVGITDLEKTDATPVLLVEKAANLLGINLEQNIQKSSHVVRYKSEPGSHGFKEQWLLRWLLKKLTFPASKERREETWIGENSFFLCAESWSMLLALTCSIQKDVCLEILQDRKFYQTLDRVLRWLNTPSAYHDSSSTSESHQVSNKEPPTKKRKLDAAASDKVVTTNSDDNLRWIILQAACRCVDLVGLSDQAKPSQSHHLISAWNSNWDERASLFGALLETSASLVDPDCSSDKLNTLSSIITTITTFWTTGSADSRNHPDGPHRAFSSQSLFSTLSLLERLRSPKIDIGLFQPVIRVLERLIALHVVLPARSIFFERFARKWRAINDVLFYDNLKNFLNDFQKTIIYWPNNKLQLQQDRTAMNQTSSLRIIFDIAARAIPSSDFSKRQSEQPWLDALFLSLAHTVWEDMPRISPSGVENSAVLSLPDSNSHQTSISALESLVDSVFARRVRLSLPVLGHTITALLVNDEQATPWTLLTKLVQLDTNILISNAGLSVSAAIFSRICGKIEDATIPDDVYPGLLNEIIIPVMRGFARSRNIDGFIQIWQEGLQNAIRLRYSLQVEQGSTPAVLVWEDDDVFDEFKTLIKIHAPLSLSKKLLEQTSQSLEGLSTKAGSTAVDFSHLAIFTAFLNAHDSTSEIAPALEKSFTPLFQYTLAGLQRASDYQAQRWRLWSFLRILLQSARKNEPLENLDKLLSHHGRLVSLQAALLNKDGPYSHQKAGNYLESLECFSVIVEAANNTTKFHSLLHEELKHLAQSVASSFKYGDIVEAEWDGRCYSCNDASKLAIACIGRLLEKPGIFSLDAKIYYELLSATLKFLKHSFSLRDDSSLSLRTVLQALLKLDEVSNNQGLKDMVSSYLIENESAPNSTNANSYVLLRSFPAQTLKKSHIKRLAALILQDLSNGKNIPEIETSNDQLATIIYLDTHSPSATIAAQDWRLWVQASEKLSTTSQAMSLSQIVLTNMLLEILQRLWSRAFALQKSSVLSEISSWVTDSIKSCKRVTFLETPHLALRTFFAESVKSQDILESKLPKRKVQKLRAKFIEILKRGSEDVVRHGKGENLLEVRLLMQTLQDTCDPPMAQEFLRDAPELGQVIEEQPSGAVMNEADRLDSQLRLSIRRTYQQIPLSRIAELENAKIKLAFETLAAEFCITGKCSREEIGIFATNLDLTIRTYSPITKTLALDYFQSEHGLKSSPILAQIATAIVASQVGSHEMMQHHPLAGKVAAIACTFPDHVKFSKVSILLALDNCKFILETHPSVVNQSTLDQLLASICTLTSPASKPVDEAKASGTYSPEAADIYGRICEVLGAVLGRHRRRISDRYHLLVPAMSGLLRCLFWPGAKTIQSLSGRDAAHTIANFGHSLPHWLTSSENALPPAAADQLARLLSSVCNPTVSAARTSRKRKHNELNDETKRARQLAGQHLLYLIAEYARCSLDGQIDPLVKEHLMLGLYSIMDAIDRELMKAMNSGMDPSSRAMFKVLYDSWVAHGKWDKS
ncbi:hypothetical protein LTR84_005112 [Exophiala bonariae]|uniref:Nucleolar 27S pre-rRNA processing Urb2/Npa2 C-terminal domain-containing protein n=1 Tax=Exophiala bonariae TaxID=1690606 RepID=A0AAV9NNV6_9EURO|nr:hypothetical protein LTR84_005112 [Exophiala bonariae]